jgi:1-acyl-sn-glycerol-3-phosphate acyltransferase
VPAVGWNMSLNRYIKLRRGDRASVEAMIRACERTLGEGSSIMMFPEGTRSADGRLKQFKPGAFVLAKDTQSPVLPIVVQGTSDALPKRGFVLHGQHHIRIRILDEIPAAQFAGLSVEALTERVRNLIAAELGSEPSADNGLQAAR